MNTPSSPSAVRSVGSSSPGVGYAITLGAEDSLRTSLVRIGESHVVVLTKLEVHLSFDQPGHAALRHQYDKGDLFTDSGFDLLGVHQGYGSRRRRGGRRQVPTLIRPRRDRGSLDKWSLTRAIPALHRGLWRSSRIAPFGH
jgi:hypothetical protein